MVYRTTESRCQIQIRMHNETRWRSNSLRNINKKTACYRNVCNDVEEIWCLYCIIVYMYIYTGVFHFSRWKLSLNRTNRYRFFMRFVILVFRSVTISLRTFRANPCLSNPGSSANAQRVSRYKYDSHESMTRRFALKRRGIGDIGYVWCGTMFRYWFAWKSRFTCCNIYIYIFFSLVLIYECLYNIYIFL